MAEARPQINGTGDGRISAKGVPKLPKKKPWTRYRGKERATKDVPTETDHDKLAKIVSPLSVNGTCTIELDKQLVRFMQEVTMNEGDMNRRTTVLLDLKSTLMKDFPNVQLHPFGSLITGLGDKASDLDVYIDCNGNVKGGQMCQVGQSQKKQIFLAVQSILRRQARTEQRLFGQIISIPSARVPIIKATHIHTQINCDLSFENFLSVRNSRLIKLYTRIDPRVRPLLCLVRYWGKFYELTDSSKIKNYGLNLLVLVFLAQNHIIPTIYDLQNWAPKGPPCKIEDWDASFCENEFLILRQLQATQGIYPDASCQRILQLMLGFCKLYAAFNASTYAICSLLAEFLPRYHFSPGYEQELPENLNAYKEWCYRQEVDDRLRVAPQHAFIIQDPFVLNYNVSGVTSAFMLQRFQAACKGTATFLSGFLTRSPSEVSNSRLMDIFCQIEFPIKQRKCAGSGDVADSSVDAGIDSVDTLRNGNQLPGDKSSGQQKQLGFSTRPTIDFCRTFWSTFSSCGMQEEDIIYRANAIWTEFVQDFFMNFFQSCFCIQVRSTVDQLPFRKTLAPPKPKQENVIANVIAPTPSTSRQKSTRVSALEELKSAKNGNANVQNNCSHFVLEKKLELSTDSDAESDDSSLSFSTIELITAIIRNPSPRELLNNVDVRDYRPLKLNFSYCGLLQDVWNGRGKVLEELAETQWKPSTNTSNPIMELEAEITRRLSARSEIAGNSPVEAAFECSVTFRPESFRDVYVEIQLRESQGLPGLPMLKSFKSAMIDTHGRYILSRLLEWTKGLTRGTQEPCMDPLANSQGSHLKESKKLKKKAEKQQKQEQNEVAKKNRLKLNAADVGAVKTKN